MRPNHVDTAAAERLPRWSAMLHEVGVAIAHNPAPQARRRLLENMDLPGFSRSEQRRRAAIVWAHRR